MLITFIGTGCGVPSKERASPSILLSLDGENILFDTGPGSIRELLKAGYTYNDIDHIFYTHFHLDHISDLAHFLFASKYPLAPRTRDINIIGPYGIKEFYKKLFALYGCQLISSLYNVNILTPEEFRLDRWGIKTAKLPHTEESIGYRIEHRRKIFVYSGDTGYSKELIELGQNADALILECSFQGEVEGHLYPELTGRIAKECRAKLLFLTHLYPDMREDNVSIGVRKEFRGEFIVARDGMRIRL